MSNGAKILASAALVIILILILDRIDLKNENEQLRKQINANEDLSLKVRRMLMDLVKRTKSSDPNVAKELASIIGLLNIRQEPSALLKLAKVIENLLGEYYAHDERAKDIAKANGRKKPVFADHLELAKERKLVDQEDYLLLSMLKGMRNDEAHKLNVRKESSRIIAALIAGITFTFALCKLLGRTSITEEATG